MIEVTDAMVQAARAAYVNARGDPIHAALRAALAVASLQDKDVTQEFRTRLDDQLMVIVQLSIEVIKLKKEMMKLKERASL